MTTLAKSNYREQPELKCCQNCKYVDKYGPYIECLNVEAGIQVSPTAICDRYEPRQ